MPPEEKLNIPNKLLFLICEVADLSGFAECTLRRWAKEDKIIHIHYPGVIKIPRFEVVNIVTKGVEKRKK
jgi:hypothetical protein